MGLPAQSPAAKTQHIGKKLDGEDKPTEDLKAEDQASDYDKAARSGHCSRLSL
jgi:hypothetical protein